MSKTKIVYHLQIEILIKRIQMTTKVIAGPGRNVGQMSVSFT